MPEISLINDFFSEMPEFKFGMWVKKKTGGKKTLRQTNLENTGEFW
jgi:hypothetical protein